MKSKLKGEELPIKVGGDTTKLFQNNRMPGAEGKEYMLTIVNRRRYMRLIRKGLKTCEIKARRVVLADECKYLIVKGNKKDVCSKGCTHFLVVKLLSTVPLGPYRTGAEIIAASNVAGQEFKTGMSEQALDRFIRGKKKGEVWVYRFEQAISCGADVIEWSDVPGNGNTGFLSSHNQTTGGVRFKVLQSPWAHGDDLSLDYHDCETDDSE